MKNKSQDLNNHLFAQLERLNDEELTKEQIDAEVKRANAMVGVADQIVANARLQVKAAHLVAEYGEMFRPDLPMLEGGKPPQANGNDV